MIKSVCAFFPASFCVRWWKIGSLHANITAWWFAELFFLFLTPGHSTCCEGPVYEFALLEGFFNATIESLWQFFIFRKIWIPSQRDDSFFLLQISLAFRGNTLDWQDPEQKNHLLVSTCKPVFATSPASLDLVFMASSNTDMQMIPHCTSQSHQITLLS